MPISLKNHRKVPFLSEPPTSLAAKKITPILEEDEAKIINAMFEEINQNFGLTLDTSPSSTRASDPMTMAGVGNVVLIGASHMSRTASEVKAAGGEVIDLATPGWSPGKDPCKKLSDCLSCLKLDSNDCVFLDVWSNSSVMGIDEYGLPCRAVKIVGHLQAAPKTVFQNGFNEVCNVLAATSTARKILVSPFARYVVGKCCDDPGHITDFGSEEYEDEFAHASDAAEATAVSYDGEFSMLRLGDLFFNVDSPISELCMAEGSPVWTVGDPVHLTKAAYSKIGAHIVSQIGDGELVPSCVRPRLESIGPTGASGGRGNKGNLATPLWVIGHWVGHFEVEARESSRGCAAPLTAAADTVPVGAVCITSVDVASTRARGAVSGAASVDASEVATSESAFHNPWFCTFTKNNPTDCEHFV